MKSKMSFFNPTLLKKNIGRFAPLWAGLTIVLFLTGPLVLMQALNRLTGEMSVMKKEYALNYMESYGSRWLIPGALLAILCAGVVFKYLHKTNSAYMMHAFPMTRTCLFVTNAVSGFLFYVIPLLITSGIYQIILVSNGIRGCGSLLWSGTLRGILQFLFFYGLAVFCMVLSGRTIIPVLSYAALNFIFYLLPLLMILLAKLFFYGLDVTISKDLTVLAPVLRMAFTEEGLETLVIVYACVGVVLLVLAWLLNRLRHVERAGDAMSYGWARVAFRLLFTLCCAIGVGAVLDVIFGLVSNGGNSAVRFLIYALIGCFLGWFGSSMMLERTVKVFGKKKIWLGFAAFAAVLTLLVMGTRYDLLGFQRRIPEAKNIAAVEIRTDDSDLFGRGDEVSDTVTLTDPADIEAIRTIHTHALEIRDAEMYYNESLVGTDGFRPLKDYDCYETLHIRYKLKSGLTLSRVYHVVRRADHEAVKAIYERPAVATAYYERVLPETIARAWLEGYWKFYGEAYEGDKEYWDDNLTCKDPAALRTAILKDAAEGRLPVVNEYTNEDGTTCWLYLSDEPYTGDNMYSYSTSFQIMETATETFALFTNRIGR